MIFSGFDDFEYAKQAIKLNVIEYILKPVNVEELTAILQKIKFNLDEEIAQRRNVDILRENVSNVVFDFEDTRFMDSSGIGIIMGRYKKIACFGGKVFAIHADHRIRRLLMISGLHKIVEIMD